MATKHVYEIYVRATPEDLWEALTDPDRMADTQGEVVESVPQRRLVMTWNRTFDDGVTEGPSRVTWEIESLGAACRLRLVHDDFHGTTRVFAMAGRDWPIVLSSLKTMLETGTVLDVADAGNTETDTTDIDALDHREWGVRANQRVWQLIAEGAPSDEAARREVVDAAHASQWHWSFVGTALNVARGEWLTSHVYALLGDGPPALSHALRCWEITEAQGFEDFDLAYGCEALARAYALVGDTAAAAEWRERATKAGALIANDEDRAIFDADLAG